VNENEKNDEVSATKTAITKLWQVSVWSKNSSEQILENLLYQIVKETLILTWRTINEQQSTLHPDQYWKCRFFSEINVSVEIIKNTSNELWKHPHIVSYSHGFFFSVLFLDDKITEEHWKTMMDYSMIITSSPRKLHKKHYKSEWSTLTRLWCPPAREKEYLML